MSVQPHAVGVLILDGEVVPNLARLVSQLLAGAHAPAFDRMVLHDPVGDVEVVNVLFADVIAAKPDVVVPVVELLLQHGVAHVLAVARLIAIVPDGSAVDPVGAQRSHVADHAVMNAFDGLDVAGPVPSLGAGGDFEVLLFCLLVGGIDGADAGTVHRDGFLHENILASFDAGLEVVRPEAWRRGKDGVVHAGNFQGLFEGIETAEAFVFGHTIVVLAAPGLLGEEVGDGDDLAIYPQPLGGVEKISPGAAAAPAEADHDRADGLLGANGRNAQGFGGGG